MKITNRKKKAMSILLTLAMIFTMMPMAAHATETEHTHEWHSSWSTDADGHWHICVAGDGCTEKDSYAAHDWNTNYTIKSCNTCFYYESHTHSGGTATCSDRATCELCGFLYGDTDPNNHKGSSYTPNDAATHKVSCQCGVTITESEAHSFLDWYDNGDGRETRYCLWCGYTEYRTIETHTHDWGDWTFNGDGTHTRTCLTDSSHTENGNCDEIEWTYDSNGHSGRWLCDVCNGGVDRESMNYPEHVYSGDTDLTCNTCGYTRSVEGSLSITGSMPDATVGEAYSASFGYTGTVSGIVFWNATGLPDGLTIDYGTGTISGTPTTAGTYEVTISMGATGGGSADKDFTLTVNPKSHKHSYSTQYNDTYHWEECDCGDKGDEIVHNFSDDADTTCDGCGYTRTIEHNHTWEYRIVNESRHEPYCPGCGETGLQGMHTYGDDGVCTVCGHAQHNHTWEYRIVNESRHEPYCPGCGETGLQGMHTWKYVPVGLNSHSGVCTVCQYESSEKKLHENNNGDDCWCDICGAGIHNWNNKMGYNDTHHWYEECDVCGEKSFIEEHIFFGATCISYGKCSCDATADKDPTNHVGGTEIRNAVDATRTEKGYTGDTYCLGCDSVIASGKEIPAKGFVAVKIADDATVKEVTFITAEGVELPEDAEVIVEDHTATIEPVAAIVGSDDEIEYITVPDSDIYVSEPPVVLSGVTYNVHEIIMINGEEFLVVETDSHKLTVMRLSDSVEFRFDGERLEKIEQLGVKAEKRENQKLNINGVTYDVVAVRDGFSSLDISILYYKGKPAGEYRSETGIATFKAGFDPATLKAQRDDIFIGRVTAGDAAVADLTPGKTYNAYVVGANDIHLEGAENVGGTVTQTFEVPAEFVGNMYVKYVAYHGLVEGYELGKTFLSEDSKTLTATYEVDSFSPFIVYAFVEADEPEIKTLSATIVDGSDDTTEAPDTTEPVVSPQTSDSWIWYVLVAVVAGAIAVVSVVYGKRRKSKVN